jgi:hypothetical protein
MVLLKRTTVMVLLERTTVMVLLERTTVMVLLERTTSHKYATCSDKKIIKIITCHY